MEKNKNGSVNKALMVGTALISLSVATPHQAQAATGTGNMTAVVLTPIAVTVSTDLHFGSITSGTAGTVTIDVAGVRGVTGGVTPVTGLAAETNALVSIAAGTGIVIDIAMGATSYTVTNGTVNMMVDNFDIGTNGNGPTITDTLTASPTTYGIGATLNVGATQAPGTYTGQFTVTASYQ